jgi:hypothetical protein
MKNRKPDDISKGHTIVPSHHPMPGVDDSPIDGGATSGAQLPSQETEKAKGELQKQKEKGSPAKGFDPDVLSD